MGWRFVPEASYKDSQGNGLAEHAVREVKSKTRQLVFQLKERWGKTLAPDAAAMTWLVMYAALQVNAARRGPDGRTAWELRYGRPFRRQVADFGEKVLWHPAGPPDRGAVERVFGGCFLGVVVGRDDVCTDGAVVKSSDLQAVGAWPRLRRGAAGQRERCPVGAGASGG